MSIHIKENNPILKKKWGPTWWTPVIEKDIITKDEVNQLIDQIFKEVSDRDDAILEIDRSMSKVIQLATYRIVIVYPPLSDGLEITVVKPIKKLSLEDYNLDENIIDLFKNKAKWILISGAPGSGKTTFAQAMVELYEKDKKIIKTIESPRDLMVPESVVQYSFTYGSHDEVRNSSDFELYKDMRLTGIWLIWVIHATRPVDSIQRFLGTIEMGIIPQVLDTVIFIDKWAIKEILQLNLTVKVPEWMESDDLARPVIQVSSFFSQQVEYEIYTFGEQIVVMPLWEAVETKKSKSSKMSDYAKVAIDRHLESILPCSFISKVNGNDIELFVPKSEKWSIVGRWGENIRGLEQEIWLNIHVRTYEDLPILDAKVNVENNNSSIVLYFPKWYENKNVYIMVWKELLHTQTNANWQIIIKKKNYIKTMTSKWFTLIDYEKI